MQLFVRCDGRSLVVLGTPETALSDLLRGLEGQADASLQDAYLQHGCAVLEADSGCSLAELGIQDEDVLTVCPRLRGGKGGFGALLRGAGRAAATDNFDAYRDLSGRRLRHVNADERLRDWARQSKEMQRQLAELKRLKDEEKASKRAAATEADVDAVRDAQRTAVAGILATMEQHFAAGTKRPQSPSPQPAAKRSKLKDLGDMDFGSDASSDDESDSDYFESLVLDTDKAGSADAPEAPEHAVADQPSGSADPQPEALADAPASSVPQGEQQKDSQPAAPVPAQHVTLESYETPQELEALGLDALKAQLQSHGLKCGGTLGERAARLFLLKSTPRDQLEAKHFAAAARKSA